MKHFLIYWLCKLKILQNFGHQSVKLTTLDAITEALQKHNIININPKITDLVGFYVFHSIPATLSDYKLFVSKPFLVVLADLLIENGDLLEGERDTFIDEVIFIALTKTI